MSLGNDPASKLLDYHLQECRDRYSQIENRLSRIEFAVWTTTAGLIVYGAHWAILFLR